jgi:magnesium-protoporphyrin O-methyltransferase
MTDRPTCDCGCANVFGAREAEGDLKRYRRNGPDSTTKALIDAIAAEGIEGATLLDIGGGIGAIPFELLDAGAASAQSIDATDAYIAVERQEAARRGFADRVTARVGDFVALAPDIDPADVVTLDKVVCCYVDMPALVGRAADRARRMVGLVFPRETWWNRVAARLIAAWGWLTRSPVRWRLHSPADIDRLLAGAGFERHDVSRDFIWHVVLYRRRIAGTPSTSS